MSQYCGFNRFMAESLRHALMFNQNGTHGSFEYTFKEYPVYPFANEGCKYIDVVGKKEYTDSIKQSVVIEVKSNWGDFNSGHGLNLYGAWNYIAAIGDFAKDLLYYMCKNKEDWANIGLLEVDDIGGVSTLIPAKNVWNLYGEDNIYLCGLGSNIELNIDNHWEDCSDQADDNGSVEQFFQTNILPKMQKDDQLRKEYRQKYPVEHLKITQYELDFHKRYTSEYFRKDILKFAS